MKILRQEHSNKVKHFTTNKVTWEQACKDSYLRLSQWKKLHLYVQNITNRPTISPGEADIDSMLNLKQPLDDFASAWSYCSCTHLKCLWQIGQEYDPCFYHYISNPTWINFINVCTICFLSKAFYFTFFLNKSICGSVEKL